MALLRVLLKRHWRTPKGRFDQSLNGVPTEIPGAVIKEGHDEGGELVKLGGLWALPTDAVLVSEDYKTPEEVAEEESYRDFDPTLTAAEQEAEINRRVNAELDKRDAAHATKVRDEARAKEDAKDAATEEAKQAVDPAPLAVEEAIASEEASDPDLPPEEEGATDAANDPDTVPDDILDQSVPTIVEQLEDFTVEELEDMLRREREDKTRSTLMVELEAAIEDRQE